MLFSSVHHKLLRTSSSPTTTQWFIPFSLLSIWAVLLCSFRTWFSICSHKLSGYLQIWHEPVEIPTQWQCVVLQGHHTRKHGTTGYAQPSRTLKFSLGWFSWLIGQNFRFLMFFVFDTSSFIWPCTIWTDTCFANEIYSGQRFAILQCFSKIYQRAQSALFGHNLLVAMFHCNMALECSQLSF